LTSGGGPELLHGLPPILDAGVRTLILGSFPSPASLAAQAYYAHGERNRTCANRTSPNNK
jgi:hypothetical protein